MIRIGIAEDHAIVRDGLRRFLSDNVDLRVTGEAANGREALELARGGNVDVLLMDISMPQQSGVDALAAIKARFPELPVLVLSGFPESHYATTLLRQGASGYLNKECDPAEIVTAIRTVFRGRKYVSPAVAEMLADALSGDGDKPAHEQLSERELQVFLRLAQDESIGHIAKGTFPSVKTVSTLPDAFDAACENFLMRPPLLPLAAAPRTASRGVNLQSAADASSNPSPAPFSLCAQADHEPGRTQ